MTHIELRPLTDDDLDDVFAMMRDPDGVQQAAFTASDPDSREEFDAWMARQRASDEVIQRIIVADGSFAGTVAAFTVDGDREVSFWTAREVWGRGIATEALRQLVSLEPVRPLFARCAAHNAGSVEVLRHNGFTEVSRTTSFAPGLGREVEEIVFVLLPALDGV
ncbi:GNAT family N-acetyltransferase [Microbacterium sp. NPDC077184]|uniref:GNAT family N-acetyltransferase n=1 Tax=Microbacterium sp. NPDC077184 TaxID=3154764 RepID=UPI00342ABBEC